MKKTIVLTTAALAMLSMAACSGEKSCKGEVCSKDCKDDVVYTGVMPAADCDGIRYTLLLDYDDDMTDGDYKLVETYIQADTLSPVGYTDIKSFASEGDFTVNKQDGKTYLKLQEETKNPSATGATTFFLVDSDSTITMTNSDLEVSSIPGMNYTLKRAE